MKKYKAFFALIYLGCEALFIIKKTICELK